MKFFSHPTYCGAIGGVGVFEGGVTNISISYLKFSQLHLGVPLVARGALFENSTERKRRIQIFVCTFFYVKQVINISSYSIC